jgi:hypothetical protein
VKVRWRREGWRRGRCVLYFEPVGGYDCREGKHVAVYWYDVFGDVETACVAHHG